MQDSDNSIVFVGGMGRDDRAMLILNLSAIFSGNVPREGITIELTPPFGQSVTQEIMFPTSMDNRVVDLSH